MLKNMRGEEQTCPLDCNYFLQWFFGSGKQCACKKSWSFVLLLQRSFPFNYYLFISKNVTSFAHTSLGSTPSTTGSISEPLDPSSTTPELGWVWCKKEKHRNYLWGYHLEQGFSMSLNLFPTVVPFQPYSLPPLALHLTTPVCRHRSLKISGWIWSNFRIFRLLLIKRTYSKRNTLEPNMCSCIYVLITQVVAVEMVFKNLGLWKE